MWRRQAQSRSEPFTNEADAAVPVDDPLGNDIIVGPAPAPGGGRGFRLHGKADPDGAAAGEPAVTDPVSTAPATNDAVTNDAVTNDAVTNDAVTNHAVLTGPALADDVVHGTVARDDGTLDDATAATEHGTATDVAAATDGSAAGDNTAAAGKAKGIRTLRARLHRTGVDTAGTEVSTPRSSVGDSPAVLDSPFVPDSPVLESPVVPGDPVGRDATADTGVAVAVKALRARLNRSRPFEAGPSIGASAIDDMDNYRPLRGEPGMTSGPETLAPGDGGSRRGGNRGAVAMLSLFLAVGLAVAGVAGWQWSRAVDRQAQQTFDGRASTVSSRVTSSLQRDADLSTALRTVVAQNPQLTNAQLSGWFSSLATPQTPEATGVMYIQRVPSADLLEFLVALAHDPTTAFSAGGPFAVTPSGSPSPYCLTKLLALRPALVSAGDIVLTPGLDWCATSSAGALATTRDTGQLTVTPLLGPDEGHALGLSGGGATSATAGIQTLKSLGQAFSSTVVFLTPVYGTTPTTTAARRRTITGWVGTMFDTGRILNAAVGSQAVQVSLSRVVPGGRAQVIATRTTGSSVGLARTITTGADGQWVITVQQAPLHGLQTGVLQGTLVGAVGGLIVLAVFSGLIALVVSRRRALDRVTEQTGELQHVTLHDTLTGLPNRDLVVDRAERMLARSRRSQLPCAALTVGLDGFKAFNDTYDRRTGDALLRAVAERLGTVLREADTVGRQNGDEFIVLTDGATLAAGPELVAERIIDMMREPFYLEDFRPDPFHITASVGIALGPRIGAEDLVRDAGLALVDAKGAGGGRFAVFGQDMPQAIESRLAFENELRSAVVAEQFFLRYQPIFDIDHRTTTGVEALLRWQHPTQRVVPPDHFLPLLEETGLIIPLGRWVLREACTMGASLHRDGYRITMSVNVSAAQLESDTMIDDVRDAITASGFDPQALVLEVTETTLMRDTALMVDRLVALKQLGVRIAIDDFGTGYSSLAYLRQFPVDILKIDRSFISSMANTRESSLLIHTLVQFGKTLGLETIAEGIEEEGQIDPLLAEQCESGQGFLYGRPLSPTQLDIFLRTHITQDPPLWVVAPKQPVGPGQGAR